MLQQAQFQQQQWQMEMMRNQQAAAGYEWGSQQGPREFQRRSSLCSLTDE